MIDPNFYTTQHIELEVAELDIDEGLKDVILATLERYEEIKAKLAEIEKQEEPIKWQSTTEVYTPYITQSRYEKLRPEFQKWYRPYVAVQKSPAVAVNEHIYMNAKLYSDDDVQVILKECSEALGVDNLTNLWQISGRIRDVVKQ